MCFINVVPNLNSDTPSERIHFIAIHETFYLYISETDSVLLLTLLQRLAVAHVSDLLKARS